MRTTKGGGISIHLLSAVCYLSIKHIFIVSLNGVFSIIHYDYDIKILFLLNVSKVKTVTYLFAGKCKRYYRPVVNEILWFE